MPVDSTGEPHRHAASNWYDACNETVDQADVIAWLATPGAYGAGSGPVERIDTHTSVVFLTGDRAARLVDPPRRERRGRGRVAGGAPRACRHTRFAGAGGVDATPATAGSATGARPRHGAPPCTNRAIPAPVA